ncbi:hypothetical protein GGF50DRAFT_112230 [Schizophyllum commune]
MSSIQGPEAQNALFDDLHPKEAVPAALERATDRLEFPPSYVVVGIYRLFTDKTLLIPTWKKCEHGTIRGLGVGLVWGFLTFGIQKKFIEVFLANSPRIVGLTNDTVFGYKVPFNVHTYAAILLLGSQISAILNFFLYKNIRIARDRAWDLTVASRGKGPDFWWPYVEEWDNPPPVDPDHRSFSEKWLGGFFGRYVVRKVITVPFALYPVVGILASAWLKAVGTARFLHKQYFASKNMTKEQIAIFMAERKWEYRTFGFVAALLEGLPIIGIVFTVSNRIGAAMWAFDLEKRQHFIAEKRGIGYPQKSQ